MTVWWIQFSMSSRPWPERGRPPTDERWEASGTKHETPIETCNVRLVGNAVEGQVCNIAEHWRHRQHTHQIDP